jgi:CDP-diacylglycerol--serine O-phosphatidyltransferase
MVSNIRYHSFKQIDLKGKVPFMAMLVIVAAFVFVAAEPPLILCAITLLYAISGPILTLATIRKHRESRKINEEDAGNT